MSVLKPLRATQRLQFHKDFTLDDATALVPYFAQLGISHIYASPLLKARAGSMHGYDVVDPRVINPELGGEPALRRLVAELRKHGMGLILDIVSNHMAVGGADNPWWLDLIEWGQRSPYAKFFDIQWNSPDPLLKGQLLLPFLSTDYGTVLQNGEVPLHFDAQQGSFRVEHYQHHFPINPGTYKPLLNAARKTELDELAERFSRLDSDPDAYEKALQAKADLAALIKAKPELAQAIEAGLAQFDSRQPDGFRRLHQLLERQDYRLASWRTAGDDINWRRFFDINELGGLMRKRPILAIALSILIFSMAGLPPFGGFFGKWEVLTAGVDAGLMPVVIILVLASVVSLGYYLRLIKIMWFDEPTEKFEAIDGSVTMTVLLAALVAGILFLFFINALSGWAGSAALGLPA